MDYKSHLESLPSAASSVTLPEIPPLDVEALLEGLAPEPWLTAKLRQLATSPHGPDRVVAVGLCLRLYHPATAAAREAEISRLRAGMESLVKTRACEWLGRLSAEAVEYLEEVVRCREGDLLDVFDDVRRLTIDLTAESIDLVIVMFVSNRDDVESLAAALRLAKPGWQGLGGGLSDLDRQLTTPDAEWRRLFARALVSPEEIYLKERLKAVSWQEPEAWWGQLVLQTTTD
jgi:hypothetical protein